MITRLRCGFLATLFCLLVASASPPTLAQSLGVPTPDAGLGIGNSTRFNGGNHCAPLHANARDHVAEEADAHRGCLMR